MSPLAEQIVALIARSITLQQQGQIQEALGCLDEAQALAPDFPVTLVKRGTLLLAMGRPRAALVDFDRSLARQAVAHVLPLRDAALHAAPDGTKVKRRQLFYAIPKFDDQVRRAASRGNGLDRQIRKPRQQEGTYWAVPY